MKYRKYTIMMLVLLFACFFYSYDVEATCTYRSSEMTGIDYNCHYLLYGVSNRYYYIDSSATNYSTIIGSADTNWNNCSSDVSFSKTTSSGTAVVRFFLGTVSDPSSPGQTIMHSSTTNYNPSTSSWPNARITLSSSLFAGNTMTNNAKKGTCAHEFGHAIGLNHMYRVSGYNVYWDANWIMTPSSSRTTNTVDSYATDVIDNHLY